VSRDDERGPPAEPQAGSKIDAILELGRRTRKPVPRALWIAAAVVAAICAIGLAAVLGGGAPPARSRSLPAPRVDREAPGGAGFGTGLAVGAAAGLALGFALARQRRDHSSRNRP